MYDYAQVTQFPSKPVSSEKMKILFQRVVRKIKQEIHKQLECTHTDLKPSAQCLAYSLKQYQILF